MHVAAVHCMAIVQFRISSNLAGLAGKVLVIASTLISGTLWFLSGDSMQQTMERASAITCLALDVFNSHVIFDHFQEEPL